MIPDNRVLREEVISALTTMHTTVLHNNEVITESFAEPYEPLNKALWHLVPEEMTGIKGIILEERFGRRMTKADIAEHGRKKGGES